MPGEPRSWPPPLSRRSLLQGAVGAAGAGGARAHRPRPRAESVRSRIVTASTPAEQFRMDVDAVISGPSRHPGWVGNGFLGEERLPVLSPDQ